MTLRDRTELEALLRELDSVTGLTDALRAQQHEFSNRLHVLSVLRRHGRNRGGDGLPRRDLGGQHRSGRGPSVADRARRRSPRCCWRRSPSRPSGTSHLTVSDGLAARRAGDPDALLTIVGNLVDNALDAVADSPAPRSVTVRLVHDEDRHLTVSVTDSGPGRPRRARRTGLPGRLHDQAAAQRPPARPRSGAGAPAGQPARRPDHRTTWPGRRVRRRAAPSGHAPAWSDR